MRATDPTPIAGSTLPFVLAVCAVYSLIAFSSADIAAVHPVVWG